MLKKIREISIVFTMMICILILSSNNAYAENKVDIQEIMLPYYYFDGFGNDKIVKSTESDSWFLIKYDGNKIELSGNYTDYAGIEIGKYFYFNEDYYRFFVLNDDGTSRFVYVDKNGVECEVERYSYTYPTLSEKYWRIINSDDDGNFKYGLYDINTKKEVIPVVYNNLLYINDNRIIVRNGELEGIININQRPIIPYSYNNIEYLNDNFIIAANNEWKYGAINIRNREVLKFEYDELHNVSNDYSYCAVMKDNKHGLVRSSDGKIVIPIIYNSLKYISKEYLGEDLVIAEKDGKFGVINTRNSEVVPFIYDRISYIYESAFMVFKDGLAGMLNNKGKVILPINFIDILDVRNGFITARVYTKRINTDYINHKYAVYNMKGKEVVPPVYDYVDYNASPDYMVVRNEGIANLVHKETGKEVLTNSEFSNILYINDKYFAGGHNDNLAIVNFAGEVLTPMKYRNITTVTIDGEEVLEATTWDYSNKYLRIIDYFKQTSGPSSGTINEISKAIENIYKKYQMVYFLINEITRK